MLTTISRQQLVLGSAGLLLGLLIVGCNGASSSGDGAEEAETADLASALRASELTPVAVRVAQQAPPAADPLDWPYWRGPNYNGTSIEMNLIDDWDPNGGEGSNVKWKRADLGGRSTPIVMNGKLYLLCRADRETPKEGEKVVCIDAVTGDTIWESRFNVWLSDVPDTRVGWSSVVGDPSTNRVYALGVCGYFQCLDGDTGETLWSVSMHERFGLLSTYGGRTNFPIICDDVVIISSIVIGWGEMAKPAHRFVAFDKVTGEVVWFNGTRPLPYDTTYSGPSLAVLNGQKALVFGSGDGQVWAIQPRTGNHIWNYALSRRGLNVAPLVVGDRIFTGHSEENIVGTAMGAVVAIDATGKGDVTKTGELWKVDEMMMGKAAPLHLFHTWGDRLYCFDDRAKLHILDSKTGEPVAPRIALGTVMRSSPLYADGKIYAFTNNGRWYILKPDEEKGVVRLKIGRLPGGEGVDASPIVSHGRIYLNTTGGLYCLENEDGLNTGYGFAETTELPVEKDVVPAHLQLVPADALSRPGQTQQYKVRLFNAAGELIDAKPADVRFSVEGKATIDADGVLTPASDAGHGAAYVTATLGDLSGSARIRIVPDLPWVFDFEGQTDPPVSWVGARYRHVLRQVDDSNVMVKISTIPKGARSRCWFGHSNLSNYTIEADVKGARTNDKMPDIGLIAQGYALDLQGNSQRLQIRSWVPQLRMAKTIDFSWEPGVWYRLKFQASLVDGMAVLKGKIWPRDEDEPTAWALEAEDEVANVQGSPGLFGNAKDAELYLDNITVTANE